MTKNFIEPYLQYLEYNKGRAPRTIIKYRNFLERFCGRFPDATKCTLNDLENYTGPELHKANLSPKTRTVMIYAIKGFFVWLHEHGKISVNPAKKLPIPVLAKKTPRGMQLENAGKLMRAPDLNKFIGVRDTAMLSLLIGCGLRISELCNLNKSHIIFKIHEGVEWLVLRIVGKGNKERLVPAPREAWVFLRAYLGHPELQAINRQLPDGDQVLFVSVASSIPRHSYYGEKRRIGRRSFHRIIQQLAERAGIPKEEAHPHALRHLFATELAEADVPLLHISEALGHASPETTKIYIRLALRKRLEAIDKHGPLRKMQTAATAILKNI